MFWTPARLAIALTIGTIATTQASAAVFDLAGPAYLVYSLASIVAAISLGLSVYAVGRQEER